MLPSGNQRDGNHGKRSVPRAGMIASATFENAYRE